MADSNLSQTEEVSATVASSPADADRQFVAATVAEFGPTVLRMASGKTELNLATMSRILSRRLGIVYDEVAREFLQRQPDQTFASVPVEHVTNQVETMLQKIAACHPDMFPMRELRPARVKKLIDAIKMSGTWHRPDAGQGLLRFVRECLCLKPGGSVTSAELHTAYCQFAHKHHLPVYPRPAFGRELARAVFKVFLKTPSNSLLRPVIGTNTQTNRRGYKGMVLIEDAEDVGDGEIASELLTNPS